MISYWKIFGNLSSLLCNRTSLLNSFLFLSRFSVSLKSLGNYFFRWFAYKSLLSRSSVLISYNMWSSNHFSISSCFACFSGSSFFRDQVQRPGPGFRSSPKFDAVSFTKWNWFHTFINRKYFSHFLVDNEWTLLLMFNYRFLNISSWKINFLKGSGG